VDGFRSEKLSRLDRIRTDRIQRNEFVKRNNNTESGKKRIEAV
jgi:hypothetical protein